MFNELNRGQDVVQSVANIYGSFLSAWNKNNNCQATIAIFFIRKQCK